MAAHLAFSSQKTNAKQEELQFPNPTYCHFVLSKYYWCVNFWYL